jgi:YVTN family beta-propeller protein
MLSLLLCAATVLAGVSPSLPLAGTANATPLHAAGHLNGPGGLGRSLGSSWVPGTVSLAPAKGSLGSTVMVNGTGFGANSSLGLTFGGAGVPGACWTTSSGSFAGPSGPCTFTVPIAASIGPNVVGVSSWSTSGPTAVGPLPSAIAYDAAKQEMFVANEASNNVTVISTVSNTVVAWIGVGTAPDACAYDPAQGEVFVAGSGSGNVTVINDTSNVVVANISVGATPEALAYDAAKSEMFVTDAGGANVSVIDVHNNSVVVNITTGNLPDAAVYDPQTGQVFVDVWGPGVVSVINDTTNTIVANISTGPGSSGTPVAIAYVPPSDEIYAVNGGGQNVTVIAAATDTVVEDIGVGGSPEGVAYDPGLGAAFVDNWGPNNVTVINVTNGTVVATLPVGVSPTAVAVDTATGDAYVANGGSANVTEIAPVALGAATFTVDASLLLGVYNGTPGLVLEAIGVGFAPNSAISLHFAGVAVRTNCTTDATGRFPGTSGTPCEFTVPNATAGSHVVKASDGTSSANTYFTVDPALFLTPSVVAVGSTENAIGVGFPATHAVTFTVAGAVVASRCTTDATGTFPGSSGTACSFPVLASAAGPENVTATSGTNESSAIFFVNTTLGLSPGSGIVGTDLHVSGFGFNASTSITFTLDGRSVLSTCSTNGAGSFPGPSASGCNLTVPDSAGGPELLIASDGSHEETGFFVVNESLSLSSATARVGATLTASGLGGPPDTEPVFTVDGVPVATSCPTDANGSFSTPLSPAPCSFTVPDVPGGPERVESLGVLSGTNQSINVGAPTAVVADPALGEVFVTNSASSTVLVIDTESATPVASIPVGSDPDALALDPAAGLVFVADRSSSSLSVISTANDSVVANVSLPSFPDALAYDAGRNLVYVADRDNVSAISVANDTIVATVATGRGPSALAYDPARGEVFVADRIPDNISVLNDTTNAIVANFSLGTIAYGLVYDSGTGEIFAATSNGVSVFGASNLTIVTNVSVGVGANAVAYDSASREVLASFFGPGAVTAICDANDSEVGTASTAAGSSGTPIALAYDEANGLVYVANFDQDNVTVLSNGYASAVLTVNASLGLSARQASMDVGQTVTVSGAGFGNGSSIPSFTLGTTSIPCVNATAGTCVAGAVTTTADGTFSAQFVVPSAPAAGNYTFSATDSVGNTAELAVRVFLDPSIGPVAATRATADVGESVTFSTTVSLGSGGYRYQWSGLPGGCSSASGATVTCNVTHAGNFSVSVEAWDSNGATASSPSTAFEVYTDPRVSQPVASAPTGTLDARASVTFSTGAANGTRHYLGFAWSGLPSGCVGASSATVTCADADAGEFLVSVTVTDSDNQTSASSPALAFTIDPALSASPPIENRTSVDLGQSVELSVLAAGGSGDYTYQWSGLPAGCAPATTSTARFSCAPTGTGAYAVEVAVGDSNGYDRSSPATPLAVDSDPTVGVVSNRTALDAGESLTISAVPSGGSGVYVYGWTGLPSGCGGTGRSLTCAPTFSGNYSVRVAVTDSNGELAHSSTVLLVVAPTLTVLPTVSPTSATTGESVNFNAGANGGSGEITYAWVFGDGTGGSGTSVDHTYGSTGTYRVTLWVNDTTGASVESTLNVTVSSPVSVAWLVGGGVAAAVIGSLLVVGLVVLPARRKRREGNPASSDAPESGSEGESTQ